MTDRANAALEPMPRRLTDILRALPAGELDALVARLGIPIVAAKRIDAPAQVARALVSLPELRDPSRLPSASAELLHRIAEARGLLVVPSIPPGIEPLVARGIVFARMTGGPRSSIELMLPHAYLVQLRTWDGEDPHGLRALLAQAPFETVSAVASHYLGRTAPPPVALSLEPAWEILSDPHRLADEIARLPQLEKRLLEMVEREGGEVDTEELLDLEREPMRLRGATGVTASRRGVGFALERRGFLLPIHPNRHVVPTEVAEVVGAAARAQRDSHRAAIRAAVLDSDHLPRRARFAADPTPLALAMAIAARDPAGEVRPGIGTPKSLLARLAQRFGRDQESVALVAALSRAMGLWDAAAASAAAPPGSLELAELPAALFRTWHHGGAWDEARPDPEVLRVSADARDPSAAPVLREMVLEALRELGEGRWVPWDAIAGYVRSDARTPGVARLLRRWAERANVEVPAPEVVARRIALETLPALGVVDLGLPDEADPEEGGTTLRLTSRGRALLSGRAAAPPTDESHFVDSQILRVGPRARVAAVLQLAPLVEIGRVDASLDLLMTPNALARALSAGIEADHVRARIEAIAPMPDTLSRIVAQASAVVGRVSWVNAAGFVWIEDGDVRELLRSRRQTADLFVDPSPAGGLLVAPGVDLDRLVRRCRSVGVEIMSEGQTVRARPGSSIPPPSSAAPVSSRVGTTSPSRQSIPARPAVSSGSMRAARPATTVRPPPPSRGNDD